MEQNNTPSIRDFLKTRYKAPNQSLFGFRIYFWILIVFAGLFSSFLSYFEGLKFENIFDLKGVSLSLVGYSLVLLFSSAVEFFFIKYKDDEAKFSHLDVDIKMFGFGALVLGIFLSFISYQLHNEVVSFFISVFLVIGVWFMWWIANSKSLSIIESASTLTEIAGDNQEIVGDIPPNYES
jgi:uncharacterized protein YacL